MLLRCANIFPLCARPSWMDNSNIGPELSIIQKRNFHCNFNHKRGLSREAIGWDPLFEKELPEIEINIKLLIFIDVE